MNQTRLPPLPLAIGALENGQNKAICSIFGFTDEDKANAEFIVRACNNHARLLAALELAMFIISRNTGHKLPRSEGLAFTLETRPAIAEAKGE